MKQALVIDRFDGESSRISQEDKPGYIVKIMENLRPSTALGDATKRTPYTNKVTSGITSLSTMKEFTDKSGTSQLFIIDGDTLEESVNTSGTYGASAAPSNNSRTSTATISGEMVHPIVINNEIHCGCGDGETTDRPFWYGYIAETDRFEGDITISAGKYLCDMYNLPTFTVTMSATESSMESEGLDAGWYILYMSPVLDGYQRGFPSIYATSYNPYTLGAFRIAISIPQANGEDHPRVTDLDLFIAKAGATYQDEPTEEDYYKYPAYFLNRVNLDDASPYFLYLDYTIAADHSYIEFDDAVTSYETFTLFAAWANFTETSEYNVQLDTRSEVSGKARYVVSGLVAGDNNATGTASIYYKWEDNAPNYSGITSFYDNYHRILGSEMYTYLGMAPGSTAISDFRFKYMAWNGDRSLISGITSEPTFSYYSPVHSPDIFPNLNIIRSRSKVVGLTNIDQDFLIFTTLGTERLKIVDNANSYQDEYYSDIRLVNQKALCHINDSTIVGLGYSGPFMISSRNVDHGVGWHMRSWWLDTFTQAEMEACVVGYNHKQREVWFSFPTYTTSPYTTGIILVLDLKMYEDPNYQSPWWRIRTNIAVKAFDINTQFNMIAGETDSVVDFNTSGTETVLTRHTIKIVENPNISRRIRLDRLYVDVTTDDTVTAEVYFDGSASSGLSLTFDTDETAFMRYICKTAEIEINTSASTNTVKFKKDIVTYKPFRK